jgi:hypothetical protein
MEVIDNSETDQRTSKSTQEGRFHLVPNEHSAAEDELGWISSSFTNGTGLCVMVKFAEDGTILIRDSKDQHVPKQVIGVQTRGSLALLANITHNPR